MKKQTQTQRQTLTDKSWDSRQERGKCTKLRKRQTKWQTKRELGTGRGQTAAEMMAVVKADTVGSLKRKRKMKRQPKRDRTGTDSSKDEGSSKGRHSG